MSDPLAPAKDSQRFFAWLPVALFVIWAGYFLATADGTFHQPLDGAFEAADEEIQRAASVAPVETR